MHDVLIELAVRICVARSGEWSEHYARDTINAIVSNDDTELSLEIRHPARVALRQVGFRGCVIFGPPLPGSTLIYLPVGDEYHVNIGSVWHRTTVDPSACGSFGKLHLQPIKEPDHA